MVEYVHEIKAQSHVLRTLLLLFFFLVQFSNTAA